MKTIFAFLCLALCSAIALPTAQNSLSEKGGTFGAADWEVGKTVFVGKPVSYENLTLFPITTHRGAIGDIACVPLDEAMRKNWLTVSEIGNVNALVVRNTSWHYVYLMAGEIVVGGKQDRIIGRDMMIPPNSGKIEISAFCVEHGRWTYHGTIPSANFAPSYKIVPNTVRERAQSSKSQSEVWDGIAEQHEAAGVTSGTGAYMDVYKDEKVVQNIDDFKKHFAKAFADKDIIGMVGVIGGKVNAVDIFYSNELFSSLYDKLVEAYINEALKYSGTPSRTRDRTEKGELEKNDIENYLSAQLHEKYRKDGDDKYGQVWKADDDECVSIKFQFQDVLMHFSSYSKTSKEKFHHGGFRIPRQER